MTKASNQRIGVPLAVWLALAGFLATGCAPVAGPPAVSAPAQLAVVGLSAADRTFMTRVAARGLYDLEVSRLTVSRAVNPGVRSYAQMLANQQTQANQELAALMRAKGVPVPVGLPADKATKLHRLSGLRPSAEFDMGYVRVVGLEDHRANIAMFEQAQRETRDPDLKAWIARMLPSLRSQLAAAQQLVSSLAG